MKITILIVLTAFLYLFSGCTSEEVEENDLQLKKEAPVSQVPENEENDQENQEEEQEAGEVNERFIAGHDVANENVLRTIPGAFIDKARENLVISYQHTSHGTHVTRGMYGLPDFKAGDDVLFAISRDEVVEGKLTLYDNFLQRYSPEGMSVTDLSTNETGFVQTTRNYLDDPENSDVNVIMWAWCNIARHDVENNYLPGMQQLISEYGQGGTNIGNQEGQRELPVHFIFMTGHANAGNNIGEGKPKNQADLINTFCEANGLFCLDYYSIDTHDMDGNYWEDAGDNGQSSSYEGNFYEDWQDAHELGEDYWENLQSPGGDVIYGAHNSQHITSNRKSIAMWWILARLAGWDGDPMVTSTKH